MNRLRSVAGQQPCHNRCPQCRLLPAPPSGRTRSSASLGPAGWARSFGHAIRGRTAMSRSKILPARVADDPDRRARFDRESRAVAALSHPNILAIFDVGAAGRGRLRRHRVAGGRIAPRASASGPLPCARRSRSPCRSPVGLSAGARQGHRAPGLEAREHLHPDRRPREDPRFRPRRGRQRTPTTRHGDRNRTRVS